MRKASNKVTRQKRLDSAAARENADLEKWASIPFESAKVDLTKSMTNAELGEWMVQVRMAGVVLNKTKPELIGVMRRLDAGKNL